MSNSNQQNDPLYQQARRAAQQQVNIDPLAANPTNPNVNSAAPRQLQLNDSNIMSNRGSSPNASLNNNTSNTNNMQQTILKPTPTKPPIALQSVLNNNVTNKHVSLNSTKINTNGGIYPLPINTNFVPGGLIYKPASLVSKLSSSSTDEPTSGVEEDGMVYLSEYSNSSEVADKNKPSSSPKNTSNNRRRSRGLSIDTDLKGSETKKTGKEGTKGGVPEAIVHKALAADVTLHKYALLYAQQQQQEGSLKVGQRLPSLSGKVCIA